MLVTTFCLFESTGSAEAARNGTRVGYCITNTIANELSGEPSIEVGGNPKSASKKLLVPVIEFGPNIGMAEPGALVTRTVVVDGRKADLNSQLEIIRFANESFLRRGWSEEFLKEREKVAIEFSKRSKYLRNESWVATEDPPINRDLWKGTRLEGSIGITTAIGTRKDFARLEELSKRENLTPEDLLPEKDKLIPQELTLRKPVTRYYDSKGKSCIAELRAYSKNPESEELILKTLRADLVALTFHVLQNCPELYEKPIIYTYGDEVSVRMYRKLGFKIQEHLTPLNGPIDHDQAKWWILAATPKDLEQFWLFGHQDAEGKWVGGLSGERHIYNINQPYPLKLPGGTDAYAMPGSHAFINKNDTVEYFTTYNATEVLPGVFAKAHSFVGFNGDQLGALGAIGANPYGIPAGSSVRFRKVSRLGNRMNLNVTLGRELVIGRKTYPKGASLDLLWQYGKLSVQANP